MLGRCLSHENGAMNGISALIKETPKRPLPILPQEDIVKICNLEERPHSTMLDPDLDFHPLEL